MKKITLYLIFFILIISCKNSSRDEVTALIEKWENKEILFPVKSHFNYYKDNKIVEVSMNFDSDFKIVNYVDSIGCTSCKMQLNKWEMFMDELDSMKKSKVSVYFYIHPSSVHQINLQMRHSQFKLPFCIDVKDEFNALNKFPSDLNFQTFLLDKNNRVVVIGNPIHNYNVRNIYLNVLSKRKSNLSVDSKTKIVVKKKELNLGSFDWSNEQKAVFKISNIGKFNLVIFDVKTSCGCTKVNYEKQPIRPNQETELTVTYKADHKEHFNKTIAVYCNAEESPIQLRITGNAR